MTDATFGGLALQTTFESWYSFRMIKALLVCVSLVLGMSFAPSWYAGAQDLQQLPVGTAKLAHNASWFESTSEFRVGGSHHAHAQLNAHHRVPCESGGEACDYSGTSACPLNCGVLGSQHHLTLSMKNGKTRAPSGQRLTPLERTNLLRPPITEA